MSVKGCKGKKEKRKARSLEGREGMILLWTGITSCCFVEITSKRWIGNRGKREDWKRKDDKENGESGKEKSRIRGNNN